MLDKCRLCNSKKVKSALKGYAICLTCTLLQKDDKTSYEFEADFTQGMLEFDYYPTFDSKIFESDKVIYHSLKSAEVFLELSGFEVIDAQVKGLTVEVKFKPMSRLDKLRMYELAKKIGSQYTYSLWAMKLK